MTQLVPCQKLTSFQSLVRNSQNNNMGHAKRIWYLSPMRAAKVQASLRIRAISPEPSLLAHTSSESRGTFRQKTRSLAPLNGWACAVKTCHDGMLEDTNSLGGAHIRFEVFNICCCPRSILMPDTKYIYMLIFNNNSHIFSIFLAPI